MVLKIIPESVGFKDYSLITGFHGIGATGYWTVKYLIQKLKAERVAFIDSSIIAPITSTEEGRITTPYELFRKDNLTCIAASKVRGVFQVRLYHFGVSAADHRYF